MTVEIKGDIYNSIDNLLLVPKNIDNDMQNLVINSRNKLYESTNKDTGRTARQWSRPYRIRELRYEVFNDKVSQDGKHSIPQILNYGRGVVVPIKAKKLFIPLSRRAKDKVLGAKIPENWIYGKDYIFTMKSKAYAGTKFIEKEVDNASNELEKIVINNIKKALGQ